MTENKQFRLVNELGDYHIKDGDDELCYDLCSPSMAKENWNNVVNRLNELSEENQQLKIRNNRQCQTLDKLYKLIEKQDWETLTGIIQELKEADERLQKEWSECND